MNKKSKKADQIGNPYRAALYLAKGDVELGLKFLANSPYHLEDPTKPWQSGAYSPNQLTQDSKTRPILAEKVLDEYKTQLNLASF